VPDAGIGIPVDSSVDDNGTSEGCEQPEIPHIFWAALCCWKRHPPESSRGCEADVLRFSQFCNVLNGTILDQILAKNWRRKTQDALRLATREGL
jgi:hypothetical protein